MGAVFIAESGQFNAYQSLQVQYAETVGVFRFGHLRVRQSFVRADFLPGKNDMHRIPRRRFRAIEKYIYSGDMAIDETDTFQCDTYSIEIGATDENIHIPRVADCGLIYASDPDSDCVSACDCVGNPGLLQCSGGPQQSLAYFFHGTH